MVQSKLQTWRYDWRFGQLSIQQDQEGVVVVELVGEETKTVLRSSPNTGELRLDTPAAQVGWFRRSSLNSFILFL